MLLFGDFPLPVFKASNATLCESVYIYGEHSWGFILVPPMAIRGQKHIGGLPPLFSALSPINATRYVESV